MMNNDEITVTQKDTRLFPPMIGNLLQGLEVLDLLPNEIKQSSNVAGKKRVLIKALNVANISFTKKQAGDSVSRYHNLKKNVAKSLDDKPKYEVDDSARLSMLEPLNRKSDLYTVSKDGTKVLNANFLQALKDSIGELGATDKTALLAKVEEQNAKIEQMMRLLEKLGAK